MKRLVATSLIAFLAMVSTANATAARDLAVIARAIAFVQGGPIGEVVVAVVDGAGADAAIAAFGAGVSAQGLTLKARKVPLSGLAASGAKVVLVPEGQSASFAGIAAAAKQMKAVTVSTDMACVQSGNCVLGVSAAPRVEIVVNRVAATANGVAFQPAFRVMIREI